MLLFLIINLHILKMGDTDDDAVLANITLV